MAFDRKVVAAILAYIFVCTTTEQAAAVCWPWSGCTEVKETRSSADLQDEAVIANPEFAKRSNVTFLRLTKDVPKFGYVRINYNFVGKKVAGNPQETFYEDTDVAAKSFAERTIFDWARSLFVGDERTFLVTLSAKSKGSSDVFWTEPVLAFTSKEKFNEIKIEEKLSFNGNSTFFRKVSDEVEISLDIRHAKTSEVDVNMIKDLFDSAGALSKVFGGPVFSVAEVVATPAYKAIIDRMMEKLKKFETSKTLSRTAVFKYETGQMIGMKYHFLAPNVAYTPFKLNVELEFKPSLLDEQVTRVLGKDSELNSATVLNLLVKPKNANAAQQLRAYLASHDLLQDVRQMLESGNFLAACERISQATADIFEPHDIALAKFAYLIQSSSIIKDRKEPACFQSNEKLFLASYNLKIPDAFTKDEGGGTIHRLRPLNKYFNNYLEALTILIKYGIEESDLIKSSISTVKNQAKQGDEEWAFRISDPSRIFFSGDPRKYFPSDIVEKLLAKKFSLGGCYERSIYSDVQADPNVIGILFSGGTNLFEAVVHFDAKPSADPAPGAIKVDLIEFRPLSADALQRYEKAYESKPCQSGWTPWKKAS